MERATRDRLTGAVILVAAAAIVVPEMLSGPGGSARGSAEPVADTDPALTTYELPLGPANATGALTGGLNQEPASSPAVPPPVTPPPVVPQPPAQEQQASPAPEQAASSPAAAAAPAAREPAPAKDSGKQESRQESRTAASTATQPARPAAASASSSRPASTTAPAQSRPATAPAAPAAAAASGNWWVQLGSFSSEQNAQALARRMRDKGFTIQVSKVNSGGRDLFRVRAGPEKSREAATALKNRLAAAGEQGTLVAP